MTNPAKDKGDRFERKALAHFKEHLPGLLVARPDRELGAGRANDRGDLDVLDDCAVQVKALDDTVRALTLAAAAAERQRPNRGAPLGVGMVPVMRARPSAVSWLMCTHRWPVVVAGDAYLLCGMTGRAVERARDDAAGIPRRFRVAVVRRSGMPDMWVGPWEAWEHAYRAYRASTDVPAVLAVPDMAA